MTGRVENPTDPEQERVEQVLGIIKRYGSVLQHIAPELDQLMGALGDKSFLTELQDIEASLQGNTTTIETPANLAPELKLDTFIPDNKRQVNCTRCSANATLQNTQWKLIRFYSEDRSNFTVEPCALEGNCDYCDAHVSMTIPADDNTYHELYEKWQKQTKTIPQFPVAAQQTPIPKEQIDLITGRWTLDWYRNHPEGPLLKTNESQEKIGEVTKIDCMIGGHVYINRGAIVNILIANELEINPHYNVDNTPITAGNIMVHRMFQGETDRFGNSHFSPIDTRVLIISDNAYIPRTKITADLVILLKGAKLDCYCLNTKSIITTTNSVLKIGSESKIGIHQSIGTPCHMTIGSGVQINDSEVINRKQLGDIIIKQMIEAQVPQYHHEFINPNTKSSQ